MYPDHFLNQPIIIKQSRGGSSGGLSAPSVPKAWDSTINVADYVYSPVSGVPDRDGVKNGANPGLFRILRSVTTHSAPGKFYAEIVVTDAPTAFLTVGVVNAIAPLNLVVGQDVNGWGYLNTGDKYHVGVFMGYSSAYTTGDVIGVTADFTGDELRFSKNGVDLGLAFNGISLETLFVAASTNVAASGFVINTVLSQMSFFPGAGFTVWG